MEIKNKEFSFEESLKYLDALVARMNEGQGLGVQMFRIIEKSELPVDRVVKVFCVAMSIKITTKLSHAGEYTEYLYAGAISQILGILQSAQQLRRIDMQTDGSILALFDTPMKKDVEDIINIAAQVRSINDVVLRKMRLPLGEQVVSIGIDYGPVSYFATVNSGYEGIFSGNAIMYSEQLAEAREDSVNISNDIYVNLSEEMQTNLFRNVDVIGERKYYFSPLINLRMRKWVLENK